MFLLILSFNAIHHLRPFSASKVLLHLLLAILSLLLSLHFHVDLDMEGEDGDGDGDEVKSEDAGIG